MSTLVLVEGELNALSVGEAFPEWDVCSPGSASDFKKDATRRFLLTTVRYYRTLIICTDYDGPGTEAAIHVKGILVGKIPNIHIALMKRDANEILIENGKEALRAEIEREMQRGL